jgi:hypothetical protein
MAGAGGRKVIIPQAEPRGPQAGSEAKKRSSASQT